MTGSNEQGCTVSASYNNGDIFDGRSTGGIAGYNRGIVRDCYNTGKISASYAGGGIAGDNGSASLYQCYNTDTVAGKNAGAILGTGYQSQILGCYYLDTLGESGTDGTTRGSAEAKSAEEFASGAVAYLLQGNREEVIWGQKIGTDRLPVLGGEKVYYQEADDTYSNSQSFLGDLDLDGDVDSDDLTLLARHVARIAEVTGTALANADVTGDGLVNSDDLTKHARYVARIISSWDQE